MIGTTPEFISVRNYTFAAGRMFTAGENAARLRYAVVEADIPDLFKTTPGALVGQTGIVYFLVFGRQRRRACKLAPVIRGAGAIPLTLEVRILAKIDYLRDRRRRQQRGCQRNCTC